MPTKRKAVGIDFGTTNSALAVLDEFGQPIAVTNREGDSLTPTNLYRDVADWVVGKQAREMAALDPTRYVERVKRELAKVKTSGDDPVIALGKESFALSDLVAAFLRDLIAQASERLGEKIEAAVVTVPAQFGDPARRLLLEAGKKAGIEILGLVNEPTAAALAYGLNKTRESTAMIYDFGGGTLDCTAVHYQQGNAEVVGSGGVADLGGSDFDARLLDRVLAEFIRQHKLTLNPKADALALLEIRDRVQRAKHALSVRGEVLLVCQAKGKEITSKLTREEFVGLVQDLLDRALGAPENLLASLTMTWQDVTDVVLVGGSTRIPAIQEGLKARSKKTPKADISPDLAVAFGAAIHAGILLAQGGATVVAPGGKSLPPPKVRFTDVTAFALGCAVFDKVKGIEKCVTIIPANTPIPCERKDTFYLLEDDQTAVRVKVLQGEDGVPASSCVEVYELHLEGLPPAPATTERIEVCYRYDENGVVAVTVKDRISGKEAVGSFAYAAGLKHGGKAA